MEDYLLNDRVFTNKPRIRETFPEFQVLPLTEGDALVTCPKVENRCGHGFIVHYPTWVRSNKLPTRPCPYCFKASRIPPELIEKL